MINAEDMKLNPTDLSGLKGGDKPRTAEDYLNTFAVSEGFRKAFHSFLNASVPLDNYSR